MFALSLSVFVVLGSVGGWLVSATSGGDCVQRVVSSAAYSSALALICSIAAIFLGKI